MPIVYLVVENVSEASWRDSLPNEDPANQAIYYALFARLPPLYFGRTGAEILKLLAGLQGGCKGRVAVLMGLNAIGAYGFLAKAHIGHAVSGDVAVAGRAADTEARISVQASVVADLDRRIAQIDSAVEKATDRGRTAVAMKLADEQRKARADLAGQRIREAKTLADLKVEKAGIDAQRKVAEADLGPVRYLATL